MPPSVAALRRHVALIEGCTACPGMFGPPVTGGPVASPVMLIGQAPGSREIEVRRPFAWTAGKTLFKWFASLGLTEEAFRARVYMAAVCRCFPGKQPAGGDRVPAPAEIAACARWLSAEAALLRPRLILPVGKLAISQLMPCDKLVDVIGQVHRAELHGVRADVIPLPHPSGASTWHRVEPGLTLLARALDHIGAHPAFRALR